MLFSKHASSQAISLLIKRSPSYPVSFPLEAFTPNHPTLLHAMSMTLRSSTPHAFSNIHEGLCGKTILRAYRLYMVRTWDPWPAVAPQLVVPQLVVPQLVVPQLVVVVLTLKCPFLLRPKRRRERVVRLERSLRISLHPQIRYVQLWCRRGPRR